MRYIFFILCFVGFSISLNAQTPFILEKGTVSFLSSRNVYVKFESTRKINVGDTLFVKEAETLVPAVVVTNKSSSSTVCRPLLDKKMNVGDELFAKTPAEKKEEKPKDKEPETPPPALKEEFLAGEALPAAAESEVQEPAPRQNIKGRISVASYSTLSDYRDLHRMRYAFSFGADHLKNSRFSVDSYVTFRHTPGEWEEVKQDLNQALKVYSLAVKYAFDPGSSLLLGRKINPRISGMGALDGLQYEKSWGRFLLGALLGSRPDYSDYSFNPQLFQAGAYISYMPKDPGAFRQSTLGFIEQRNAGKVDRRLVYFQHSGELLKNLNLFSSFEVDLYENINNEVKNKPQLTNLYLSLRYQVSRNLRLSASYDNRRNIIYYESYKNFIDQLIEDETRQGLRFGISYRPFKFVTWGINSGMRFQKSGQNASRNLNSNLSFSRIPGVNIRASLQVSFLQTNYLESRIYGVRLSREIIRRRLDAELYYRLVDYQYKSSGNAVQQSIAGSGFSLRLLKKLTLYLYYEGTFDNRGRQFHRFNSKIIQRF